MQNKTKAIIAGAIALVLIAVGSILIFAKPAKEEVVIPDEEIITVVEDAATEEIVG